MLRNILPRARDLPIELGVEMGMDCNRWDCVAKVRGFLELVSPRLVRLEFTSEVPWTISAVLHEYLYIFPELRELTATPWTSLYNGSEEDCACMVIHGSCMPKLTKVDLRADLRIACEDPWPALRSLRCKCEGLAQIESLLVSASSLQRLTVYWTVDLRGGITRPSAALVAALRAIPAVDITAEVHPDFEDAVFDIFGCSPAPRVHLAFNFCEDHDGPFRPRLHSRLAHAVHLTISVRRDAIVIIPDDGSVRETLISLCTVLHSSIGGEVTLAIDWAMIPSFKALKHLSADAALWPDFMRNFPGCLHLSDITLAVRSLNDIPAVLAAATLPQAESLNLISAPAVELSPEQVDALKTAFGANHVAFNSD